LVESSVARAVFGLAVSREKGSNYDVNIILFHHACGATRGYR